MEGLKANEWDSVEEHIPKRLIWFYFHLFLINYISILDCISFVYKRCNSVEWSSRKIKVLCQSSSPHFFLLFELGIRVLELEIVSKLSVVVGDHKLFFVLYTWKEHNDQCSSPLAGEHSSVVGIRCLCVFLVLSMLQFQEVYSRCFRRNSCVCRWPTMVMLYKAKTTSHFGWGRLSCTSKNRKQSGMLFRGVAIDSNKASKRQVVQWEREREREGISIFLIASFLLLWYDFLVLVIHIWYIALPDYVMQLFGWMTDLKMS